MEGKYGLGEINELVKTFLAFITAFKKCISFMFFKGLLDCLFLLGDTFEKMKVKFN